MDLSSGKGRPYGGKDDASTSSDEWRGSLHDIDSCISIQKEISDCFKYIKTVVKDDDFVSHVKNDSPGLKDIEDKLDHNLLDLKRTDGAIVFAGETSSGKSSIVNAFIGEKILPTGIIATTTSVCRVKHSTELKIATRDEKDLDNNSMNSFTSKKQLAEELKTVARTSDKTITFVDIFIPIPFLQGNITIVDTPGIGDIDQEEVAEKMKNYLPNALAFVFVINVAAAGGLQKDRFIPILEHVKKSLRGMVSFDHDDVIFLLNKWDTLLDDDEKDTFFDETKRNISSIWKDVKKERILKLSMKKDFGEHENLLNIFKGELREVINRNKEKRFKVHLRFLRHFITECDRIVLPKLESAKENAKKSRNIFLEALLNVSNLEKIWQEETLKLDENMQRLLDELTDNLHEYIHQPSFKDILLQKVATSWTLTIGFDVNAEIEKETKKWEEMNVNQIYKDTFVNNLNDKLKKICGSLATHLMRGFQMPYDPEKRVLKGILQSAISIAGGFAVRAALFEPPVAVAVAVTGVIFAGLQQSGFLSDFKTVCENAIDVRIRKLSKLEIKRKLSKRYSSVIRENMADALQKLKCEIDKLREEANEKETENNVKASMMNILISLDGKVFKCKEHLKKIEQMCLYPNTDE